MGNPTKAHTVATSGFYRRFRRRLKQLRNVELSPAIIEGLIDLDCALWLVEISIDERIGDDELELCVPNDKPDCDTAVRVRNLVDVVACRNDVPLIGE